MPKIFTKLATATLALSIATQAGAVDNSLYAEAAPDDASFVRFVGFDAEQTAAFAGKEFALNADEEIAYIPVSTALLQGVPVGTYATVFRGKNGQAATVIEGPRNTQSKVFLFLINNADTALDLRLADNSATVIETVGVGSAGQRAVNPVAVTLGVFAKGTDTPLGTYDVSLKRGQNISFVVDKTGIQLIENRFGAVAK